MARLYWLWRMQLLAIKASTVPATWEIAPFREPGWGSLSEVCWILTFTHLESERHTHSHLLFTRRVRLYQGLRMFIRCRCDAFWPRNVLVFGNAFKGWSNKTQGDMIAVTNCKFYKTSYLKNHNSILKRKVIVENICLYFFYILSKEEELIWSCLIRN